MVTEDGRKTTEKTTHFALEVDGGGAREIALVVGLLKRRRGFRAHHLRLFNMESVVR